MKDSWCLRVTYTRIPTHAKNSTVTYDLNVMRYWSASAEKKNQLDAAEWFIVMFRALICPPSGDYTCVIAPYGV